MNITPSGSYKKPLYVLGVATAIMTIVVTGCTDPKTKTLQPGIDYAGDVQVQVTEKPEE